MGGERHVVPDSCRYSKGEMGVDTLIIFII